MCNSDTATQHTTRDIRALWYIWFAPELGRHYPIADSDDELVIRAAHVIRMGHDAMVAAAEGDAELRDLFDVVYALPAPSERTLEMLRRTTPPRFAPAAEELADDLFAAAEPGLGSWPDGPAHTCAIGQSAATVITLNPTARKVSAAPMVNPEWRRAPNSGGRCEGCYHDRVHRAARAVAWEADRHPLTLEMLPPAAPGEKPSRPLARWTSRHRTARHRGGAAVRYLALPQPDGSTAIISTATGGEPVGRDRDAIYRMMWGLLETPDGRDRSHTNGWGGPWQGARGDGRRVARARAQRQQDIAQAGGTCIQCGGELNGGRVYCGAECQQTYIKGRRQAAGIVQRWTAQPVRTVALALGHVKMRDAQRQFTIGMDAVDAVGALLQANIITHGIGDDDDERRRYGEMLSNARARIVEQEHTDADDAAADADDVTHDVHLKPEPECTSCVTHPTAPTPRRRITRRPATHQQGAIWPTG